MGINAHCININLWGIEEVSSPLEKDIETKVAKYAKEKGFITYKFTSPSNRSVPDRLFISPRGRITFIEFKRKGKLPTELQQHTIDIMLERGVDVKVVDNYELGKQTIEEWLYD